jgi:hypothetical protein
MAAARQTGARPTATRPAGSGPRRAKRPVPKRGGTGAAKPRAGAPSFVVDLPALLLLVIWAAARLYPFVPSLDPAKYWRAIYPFLWNPLPVGGDAFRLCLCWLLCAMLVESTAGAARTVRLFAWLAGCIMAGRAIIIGGVLTGSDIDGAVVALGLWLLLFRRAPARHAVLATFFAAMVVTYRLATPPRLVLPALLDGLFLAGGLVWLLAHAGLRPPVAAGAAGSALLALGLVAAHRHLAPASFADAAAALAMGGVMAAAGKAGMWRHG